MNYLTTEFSNARTNWQWVRGLYTPDGSDNFHGVVFSDESIIADYLIRKPFYTWTNFRIRCDLPLERINLWAAEHDSPKQYDPAGVTFQSGGVDDTYGKRTDGFYRDSDRLYFWIKSTNQDENYWMSRDIYDPAMSLRAVRGRSLDTPRSLTKDSIINNYWLGWNPATQPQGADGIAHRVSAGSPKADVARWIMGWDNQCMNVYSTLNNPLAPGNTIKAVADIFRMIDGVGMNGSGNLTTNAWLGCRTGKYIYGKLLYCLEDHDFENHQILVTSGVKAFGVEGMGLYYG